MRLLSMLGLLAVGAGAPLLSAQESRLSATPFVAYVSPSPIYQHDTQYTDGRYEVRSSERLTVADAVAAGARIDYRLGRAWAAYVSGSYAPTDLEFIDQDSTTSQTGSYSTSSLQQRAKADIIGFALGVSRWMHWHDNAPELGLSLGAGWQRFDLEKRQPCNPAQGYYCGPAERWEDKYDVPSVTGSFGVRRHWGPLGVEAQTTFTAGRANTESFWVNLVPELDEFEAPKAQWVRTAQASLGVSLRL